MTSAAYRIWQSDPLRLEPDGREFGLEQPANRAHPGQVERAAADVDRFLQKGNLFPFVLTDVVADVLLRRRQRRNARGLSKRELGTAGQADPANDRCNTRGMPTGDARDGGGCHKRESIIASRFRLPALNGNLNARPISNSEMTLRAR